MFDVASLVQSLAPRKHLMNDRDRVGSESQLHNSLAM